MKTIFDGSTIKENPRDHGSLSPGSQNVHLVVRGFAIDSFIIENRFKVVRMMLVKV